MLTLPRLKTLYQEPLRDFEIEILKQLSEIEAWFQQRWQQIPALLTTSVDLRVSARKIAPIDTNVFPAGFNNLTEDMKTYCVEAIRFSMSQLAPKATSILILTENHTRNAFYLESLSVLSTCFTHAGFSVSVSALAEFSAHTLSADVVVLNHDLSIVYPDVLKDLKCPIYPSPYLGWWRRSKSQHFKCYDGIVTDFCQQFSLNKQVFSIPSMKIEPVDFMKQTGFEALATAVDALVAQGAPFVTIKVDKGTYGMGVMMVNAGSQVLAMNRRHRSHMAARKGGEKVTAVLVQEGVETLEKSDAHSAEPVIYLIGSRIVGGFYRVHPAQSTTTSLNSPGMYFKPCEFETTHQDPQALVPENRFYVYGVIARLAALAAAHESEIYFDRL